MSTPPIGTGRQASGTIIRTQNGDILRYDSTGLVMVLSDQVIDDISRRLPGGKGEAWLDPAILGDIDAWDLREDGEWYVFQANLRGRQGSRQFRRLKTADTVDIEPRPIADTTGPVQAILSLGGPRRATGFNRVPDFPWHVLSPADDIGAVGHGGEPAGVDASTLEPIRDLTRDAAIADVLITDRFENHQALPTIICRAETDSAPSIAELAQGAAYENLLTAIDTAAAAAKRMGRRLSLYSIGIDYSLEDVTRDPDAYRNGIFDLVHLLNADIGKRGLRCPPMVATFECGTHQINDHPLLRAQWELAWQGPQHGLTYTAPSYMFKQDAFGRPDLPALEQMAEMDAAALTALHAGQDWSCPIFLLAEREPDPTQIRVRAQALGPLEIDPENPFGAANHGFSLQGATNGPKISTVIIAKDDPQDILITFDKAPEGDQLELCYAFGQSPKRDPLDYPAACGAIRDDWSQSSRTGVKLHRWALPCALPVW